MKGVRIPLAYLLVTTEAKDTSDLLSVMREAKDMVIDFEWKVLVSLANAPHDIVYKLVNGLKKRYDSFEGIKKLLEEIKSSMDGTC